MLDVRRLGALFAEFYSVGEQEMRLLPPPNHKLSLLGAYIGYPLGKIGSSGFSVGEFSSADGLKAL